MVQVHVQAGVHFIVMESTLCLAPGSVNQGCLIGMQAPSLAIRLTIRCG